MSWSCATRAASTTNRTMTIVLHSARRRLGRPVRGGAATGGRRRGARVAGAYRGARPTAPRARTVAGGRGRGRATLRGMTWSGVLVKGLLRLVVAVRRERLRRRGRPAAGRRGGGLEELPARRRDHAVCVRGGDDRLRCRSACDVLAQALVAK